MSLIDRKLAKDTNVPSNDCISRQAAIDAVGYYSLHSGDNLLFADNVLKDLPPAQPDQNAYEQGRITGRVEMRTEMLSALKSIVGSEVWNNV